MVRSQLLCTFLQYKDSELVLDYITKYYTFLDHRIFCFSNKKNNGDIIYSYNIIPSDNQELAKNTILIHRKKDFNTLYTINALNHIIEQSNNGVFDSRVEINWENYQDQLILFRQGELKRIFLKFEKIIKI